MLTSRILLFSFLLTLSLPLLPANAQSISKRAGSTYANDTFVHTPRTSFDNSFDAFNRDLSETGDRMTQAYANMNFKLAQRQNLDAQSNFLNNYTSQQAFSNSEVQALNSGGLYNTPGSCSGLRGSNIGSNLSTWW
jgi:hypothetical protein